jgi:zinc/manganese transport system substrate-binding protein
LATVGLALTTAALTAGCGSADDAPGGGLDVVATTGIAADITGQIGGDDVEVAQLISGSVSPHEFQASAKDRRRIEEADLLVEFGTGLEATVPSEAAGESFTIAEHVGELREGEDEDEMDPHVWMDPSRIASAVESLATALGDADPANAAAYEERVQEYARRLRALDEEIAERTGALPAERRKLVTSHDALGYFAEHYGFEVIATPFGLSPEAEASASDIEAVVAAVEAEGVPAVFVEQGDDPQVLERVADETRVEVVDDLLIEGFGPGADSYEEMIRFTATRIADALGG